MASVNVEDYEKRAIQAEKIIGELKAAISSLERGSPAGVLKVSKVPLGHTNFSWAGGVSLPAGSGSSQQSVPQQELPALNSAIVRHGGNEPSGIIRGAIGAVQAYAPANFFKLQAKKGLEEAEVTLVPIGLVLQGDAIIAKFLGSYFAKSQLYPSNIVLAAEVDQWVHVAATLKAETSKKVLDEIESHLALRTYLVEYDLTIADLALWDAIKRNNITIADSLIHTKRWFNFISSFPSLKSKEVEKKKEAPAATKASGSQGAFLELKGAEQGKVVTRFPPEPSGYLHIGHAKAALLNNYYARHYNGKLILRFDDTNPTKENDDFVSNIMKDLEILDIHPDKITNTSDYFDEILKYGERLLKSGNAYIDTISKEQMRKERMDGIESAARSNSIEENLSMWEEMKNGTEKGKTYAYRAKIDMKAANKVLRDPVFFRCVDTPHHKTGTKYKVYPMYDFACPIVDSIEGVTHSLRSNEYHDRNALYEWVFQQFPDLRHVEIEDFSRLNFKYVLLSKRKLQKFVESGLVENWDDPSFPTIQGVTRRGLCLEVLKEFVISQGASKATNLMEMEKLWVLNKKFLDPIVPRFTALPQEGLTKVILSNGPSPAEKKLVPKHKKNPDLGQKELVYTNVIYLDLADAKSIAKGEEITLMDWGNAIIEEKIETDGKLELKGRLHLEGDFKTTKKKLTWLPEIELLPVTTKTYDYLITKDKFDEGDDVDKFINPKICVTEKSVGDPNLKELKQGDKIQLERRGYYRVDHPANSPSGLVLIEIPDGSKKKN